MEDTHVRESIPAYALGALDAAEANQVAQHVRGCPACEAELAAFEETAALLALASPQADPPPDLKQRLMSGLDAAAASGEAPRRSLTGWLPTLLPLWLPVSLVLLVVLAGTNLLLLQRVRGLEARPQSQFVTVALSGTESAPAASAVLVIDPDGESAVLFTDALPVLGLDQQYQLWLIADGQRDSGGVFSVEPGGRGTLSVQTPRSLFEYDALGITVEPAGGSPGPTGERVLGGEL